MNINTVVILRNYLKPAAKNENEHKNILKECSIVLRLDGAIFIIL